MKFLLQFFLLAFPWKIRRSILVRLFDYEISSDARIGITIIRAKKVKIGKQSKIGNLNYIGKLDALHLGEFSQIGNLNWITAFPSSTKSKHFCSDKNRTPVLKVEDNSAITNRHILDCTGGLFLGSFSTFAGFRSQVLTHSIDFAICRQTAAPVKIGKYCFVGTGSILLPGTSLPDFCILGAGSVLNKYFDQEFSLYAGNPAHHVKRLDTNLAYFFRDKGYVD